MGDKQYSALKCETDFLSGVGENFERAKGKLFRGTSWQRTEGKEYDRLKAAVWRHQRKDHSADELRDILKELPQNRHIAVHGFERRLLFWRRRTGVAIASVLSSLEHYASGAEGDAPPVSLGALTDHVQQLMGDGRVAHLIGVCSPSGFTDEARQAQIKLPHAVVVLIEPDGSGGWKTTGTSDGVDASVLELFDPEGAGDKVERVQRYVDEHSGHLLTSGLSVSSIAEEMQLPVDVVRRGLEQVAGGDPELLITRKSGEMLLYRGASVHRQERSMNVIERIKQLFSGEGDEAEKINVLSERRATLGQRRDRIYEDIAKLEKREAELLSEGKAAKSQVPRRRLAAQLSQLRKDISRQNTTAAMLNKQVDIISTDIHNLTLIRQGEAAQLPDTTELTEHAVQAEEMLETLRGDAELVSSLETGIEESLANDEELAILKEFEAEETDTAPATQAKSTSPTAAPDVVKPEAAADLNTGQPQREKRATDGLEGTSRSADAEAS